MFLNEVKTAAAASGKKHFICCCVFLLATARNTQNYKIVIFIGGIYISLFSRRYCSCIPFDYALWRWNGCSKSTQLTKTSVLLCVMCVCGVLMGVARQSKDRRWLVAYGSISSSGRFAGRRCRRRLLPIQYDAVKCTLNKTKIVYNLMICWETKISRRGGDECVWRLVPIFTIALADGADDGVILIASSHIYTENA